MVFRSFVVVVVVVVVTVTVVILSHIRSVSLSVWDKIADHWRCVILTLVTALCLEQ